jgi:Zn ribbon nucleic-acid-binding protein
MNYTPLDDAYKIHHVTTNTYKQNIQYNPICIFCSHIDTIALMKDDGGSFRQCKKCRKQFRATVVTDAIKNYSYSTHHLKGTN